MIYFSFSLSLFHTFVCEDYTLRDANNQDYIFTDISHLSLHFQSLNRNRLHLNTQTIISGRVAIIQSFMGALNNFFSLSTNEKEVILAAFVRKVGFKT